MRLSPLSQVRSAITGKNRFPVTIQRYKFPLNGFRFRAQGTGNFCDPI